MTPVIHWYSVSEFAGELNKHRATITRWIHSGFIVSLGHKLRRDETGHWSIGVREDLHFPAKYTLSQSSQQSRWDTP